MAKKIVHCRVCGEAFDRNSLIEGIDWIMPSKNYYYHKSCYENYQHSKTDIHSKLSDEKWFDVMWDYLRKDLKMELNYYKIKSQWDNFLGKKMTAKGIFFTLKYFYEIKKADRTKSEYGIGIVPHIYNEGCSYWQERESREKGICTAIEQQMMERRKQKTIVANHKEAKKKAINAADQLAAIMDMEEDE